MSEDEIEEENEEETVAKVQFGRVLTEKEKQEFEAYVDSYGFTTSVDFYEEEI